MSVLAYFKASATFAVVLGLVGSQVAASGLADNASQSGETKAKTKAAVGKMTIEKPSKNQEYKPREKITCVVRVEQLPDGMPVPRELFVVVRKGNASAGQYIAKSSETKAGEHRYRVECPAPAEPGKYSIEVSTTYFTKGVDELKAKVDIAVK